MFIGYVSIWFNEVCELAWSFQASQGIQTATDVQAFEIPRRDAPRNDQDILFDAKSAIRLRWL
jgi:hypothetical protein